MSNSSCNTSILAYANKLPQLLDNYGNIALLQISPPTPASVSHTLADRPAPAYRFYRQQQHNTRLRDADKVEINRRSDGLLPKACANCGAQVFGEEVRFQAR